MDTYTDDQDAERCDNCGELVDECVCRCVECGDALDECACDEGPTYPATPS